MKVVIQCGDPAKLIWSSPTTFYFPERYFLHPKLHIEFVEGLLRDSIVNEKYHKDMFQNNIIYIITNSEHILNRFRVAKKEREIEILEIQFYPFGKEAPMLPIRVDINGELDKYPKDFMDEWSNLLMRLI
jgi:hypothetical protein